MFSRIAAVRGRTIVCTLIVTVAAACTDTTAPSTTATATQVADVHCSTAVTSLSPGQVLTGLGATSLCVAGGTSGGEFALVPFNTSLDGTAGTSFIVDASGVTATAVASLLPTGGTFNVLGGAARTSTTLYANTESACTSPDPHTGRVAAVSDKAIIVADTSNPASGYTDADYATIAFTFDSLVDPTDTKAFGSPTDIDGNGHVVLFFTRAVNALTPARGTSYVAGFFYARDLFPSTPSRDFDACAGSNGGEMFYLLVPDPTGVVNGNKFTKDNVTRVVIATLGHEYQHLINASRRMYVNTGATEFETTWLDEGLSHVAEELLFYAESGLTPRANIDATTLRTSSAYVDAFNNDAISNFSRLETYLGSPSSNSPFADNDDLATRGATWSFLRYAADHTGSDDGTTWYRLVNSTTSGIANLQQVFGTGLTALARDWATSVFADDVASTDVRYQQPSWNLRSIFGALESTGAYRLVTRTLGASPMTVNVNGGSVAYLRFAVSAGQTATVQLSTLPSNVQLTLVRTR